MRIVSKTSLLTLLAVVLAFSIVGCKKDDTPTSESINVNKEVYTNADKTYPVLKGPLITKQSIVYLPTDMNWSTYVPYETKKVMNKQGTIKQEWLMVDLHSRAWYDCSTQPNDPTGTTHGMYYTWVNNFESWTRLDWDGSVSTDVNGLVAATGFHIPTDDDIDDLAKLIGSTGAIRTFLNIEYDGCDHAGPSFSTDYAAIWADRQHPLANALGCGTFAQWVKEGNTDHFYYFRTGVPNLGVNVRLVRNLTSSQW